MARSETPRGASTIDALLTAGVVLVAALLLRPTGPVARIFTDWQAQRSELSSIRENWDALSRGPARLGPEGASAIIVAFIDYECRYCRSNHSIVRDFVRTHPHVAVVVRQLPLREIHPHSEAAAIAAVCAAAQGHFESMHEYLMTSDEWSVSSDWQEVAADRGVEVNAAFDTCVGEEAMSYLIEDDRLAERIGVDTTPVYLSRHGVHAGSIDSLEILTALAGM